MLVLFLDLFCWFSFLSRWKQKKKVFEYKQKVSDSVGMSIILQVLADDYSISSVYFWPELGC